MRVGKHILSISLLLFALAWSLWYVFAGFGNPQDPLYWLYKYQSMEGGWLSVGSLLVGGGLVRLFGAQLLPLRIAGWLCVVVAIALPYICLQDRNQRRDHLHWLALAYGLMGYGAFQELSPGTLTVLLLSGIATLAVRYMRVESTGRLTGLAVLTGMAIAVRFPNILAVPVLLLLLWRMHGCTKRFVREATVYAAATVISTALLFALAHLVITPAYADAGMGSHQFGAMLVTLLQKSVVLLTFMLIWGAVMLLPKADRPAFARCSVRYVIAGLVMGGLMIAYVTFGIQVHQWYNMDLLYLISSGCLVIALAQRQREPAVMAALLTVAALGTDTGWLKLFPAVLCLLPVASMYMQPSMRQYLFPVMLGLTVAAMVRFSVNSIGDCNLRYATTETAIAPYQHIRITPQEEQWLKRIQQDYDSIAWPNTLALGREAHRMRAVTGCKAAMYNEFWSNIFDSVFTSKYQVIIEEQQPVVFCFYAPGFKTKPEYQDGHSALEEMLRDHGYREIDRSTYRYMIYIPNDGTEIR